MIDGGSVRDSDFDRVMVLAVTSAGSVICRYVPIGMPRVPKNYLDCVFYLHESEEDARVGRQHNRQVNYLLKCVLSSSSGIIHALADAAAWRWTPHRKILSR